MPNSSFVWPVEHTQRNSAVNEEKSEFKNFVQYEEEEIYEEDDDDNEGGIIIVISPTGSVPHGMPRLQDAGKSASCKPDT